MRRNLASSSNPPPMKARTYFTKANNYFNNVSKLFQSASEDYFLPVQYRYAEKQLEYVKNHLSSLSTTMDTISSLSLSDRRSVIDKIALIIECTDNELLPFIEKEDTVAVREGLQSIALLFDEIYPPLFAIEAPMPQAHPIELHKHAAKKSKHHPQLPPDLPNDPDIFNWREVLIKTIMNITSLSDTYDGRTHLIRNISDKLKRDQGSARLDLGLIIDQLDKLGRLSSGKWPLLLLIENALPFIEGFLEPEQSLKRVQKALEDLYKER